MSTAKKVLLWNYRIVWIERDLFGKPLESAGQENLFLSSLVISLHYWFKLGRSSC